VVKFLIDECLSLDLVDIARNRGFTQSSHVVWLGKAGWKDWELKRLIVDEDWTFVTRDSVDFRGPAEYPGTRGQYADVAIHAGLVCINGPTAMNLELQCELFSAALDEIGNVDQLVNEVVEVDLETPEAEITIRRYTLPG
jgi:hypothetical protein